jgi:hypothetical protein
VYAGASTCGPHYYGNDSVGGYFAGPVCTGGGNPDTILYSIRADAFSSTISKADANAKANAELAVKGPISASMKSVCGFNNVLMSRSYFRNNCAAGLTPDTIVYTVPAGKYRELTQAAANAKAAADTAANGQAYANSQGGCHNYTYTLTVGPKPGAQATTGTTTIKITDATGAVIFTVGSSMFDDARYTFIGQKLPFKVEISGVSGAKASVNGVEANISPISGIWFNEGYESDSVIPVYIWQQ